MPGRSHSSSFDVRERFSNVFDAAVNKSAIPTAAVAIRT
jgi:hypothetical protein